MTRWRISPREEYLESGVCRNEAASACIHPLARFSFLLTKIIAHVCGVPARLQACNRKETLF